MFSRSAAFYDAVYAWKDYAEESARVHRLIQERRPGARTLLDVACGTGGHLRHLSRLYEAEGLDLDPEILAVAAEYCPGVPLHVGDMTDFDLGRRFDAVVCLFSSIGYARTLESLHAAAAAMARHLEPGGVVLVEPWLSPDDWLTGKPHLLVVDEPELKLARINTSGRDGRLSVVEFHYLVGTPESVEHFTELHELALFTHTEYVAAFEAAGLRVEHDPEGLMGRGLYACTS
jgi:SAM-dependent methyltransferase